MDRTIHPLAARRAIPDDADAIHEFASRIVRAEMANTHPASAIERFISRVYAPDSIRRSIESEGSQILLAFVDAQIVGLCTVGSPLMDDCEDRKEIHRLLIDPAHDFNAVGAALLAAVENQFNEDADVWRISVYVSPDDAARVRFFAKMGFHHELVEDKDDLWYMEKDLTA